MSAFSAPTETRLSTLASPTAASPTADGPSREADARAPLVADSVSTPYLITHDLVLYRRVTDDRLATLTERHKVTLPKPRGKGDRSLLDQIDTGLFAGLILELDRGWPNRNQLLLAYRMVRRGRRVFFYFTREQTVEVVDSHRLWSYLKLFVVAVVGRSKLRLGQEEPLGDYRPETLRDLLIRLRNNLSPVPMKTVLPAGSGKRVPGTGLYLRTDYWARITSGGSYGHTCYIAWKLAERSGDFCCIMANNFPMLDDLGVRQVEMPHPSTTSTEHDLSTASAFYYKHLRLAFEAIRPAYIYERFVTGSIVGARLSRELGIPYVVEFNGSETTMMRSFGDRPYELEELFIETERQAFRQATVISVVSDAVRDQVIARGGPPERVLVNPNGADHDHYCPLAPAERRERRTAAGYDEDQVVIGFIGTFGGWHGIEILAAAIPRICERIPQARFLLIGDGNLYHLIEDAVETNNLSDKVRLTGSLPQQESIGWLQLCDVFVSPHHRNMEGIRFFGSPTKLFEYMALAGGIVASDLEQIGEVLSPALRPQDFADGRVPVVTDQRAVLCQPGSIEEFVDGVIALCRHPDLARRLGANARQAIIDHYSWDRHVDRLLDFLGSVSARETGAAPAGTIQAQTGEWYKDEVQNQWDNDPCGSHYIGSATLDRAEWFRKIREHRYGVYAPWMPEVMEFDRHPGKRVLEVGGGLGNDLSQFARGGALVTDFDLSAGHLRLAQENFAVHGLTGEFRHGDAENMPFDDGTFDVVYSNGVIHHTPDTHQVVDEIFRVLKPGGRAIIMVYAENSKAYWSNIVWKIGILERQLLTKSPGELMSRHVEISSNDATPLVKAYTAAQLRAMFHRFEAIDIVKRQLMAEELPSWMSFLPLSLSERAMGWNLIIKARKPLDP